MSLTRSRLGWSDLSDTQSGSGIGTSTIATLLAWSASTHGRDVVLVDFDMAGGGLDLPLGLEGADGLRWPDLTDARGVVSSGALRAAGDRIEGRIEGLCFSPSGSRLAIYNNLGWIEVIDVAEEGSVRVTFEQSGEQVPPGLQPPPRQIGDGRPTGDRVQAGERIGLIADHPCVDDHSVGRFEQATGSASRTNRSARRCT